MGRQEDPEFRTVRRRIQFDQSAMVINQLGYEREAKARTVGFRCDKRVKKMLCDFIGYSRAVIRYRDHQRKVNPSFAAGNSQPYTMAKTGFKRNFTIPFRHCLRCVLDEIQEYLDQLVAVANDRRQGRIIFIGERHMPGETCLRGSLHPFEHFVNINRRAIQRTIRNEAPHTIHQRANAISPQIRRARS